MYHNQVKCLNVVKPRCLSLSALDWEDSSVVRPFRDRKQLFFGNIDQVTGEYTKKNERRRASISAHTPLTLLPASKRARYDGRTSQSDGNNSFNENDMDENIKEHFLGKWTLKEHYHSKSTPE